MNTQDIEDGPKTSSYVEWNVSVAALGRLKDLAVNESIDPKSPNFRRAIETLQKIEAIGRRAAKLVERSSQIRFQQLDQAVAEKEARRSGRLA